MTDQKYLTIKQFAKEFPVLSESAIRWQIFSNPEFNKVAVRRLGRRVLLNVKGVWEFIENNTPGERNEKNTLGN